MESYATIEFSSRKHAKERLNLLKEHYKERFINGSIRPTLNKKFRIFYTIINHE